ncbi:hypothetical protein GCM10010116_36130 [Microbispora rosea subsp. aerata]|nr:hypothetical protein GCM10010116_36130 [Microbispora rosea subsp. aerata]
MSEGSKTCGDREPASNLGEATMRPVAAGHIAELPDLDVHQQAAQVTLVAAGGPTARAIQVSRRRHALPDHDPAHRTRRPARRHTGGAGESEPMPDAQRSAAPAGGAGPRATRPAGCARRDRRAARGATGGWRAAAQLADAPLGPLRDTAVRAGPQRGRDQAHAGGDPGA